MRSILFKNSASALALYIVNIVITFIVSPIMVHALGNRDYGAWDIVIGLVGYLGVLDLGISPAIVSRIARESAKDNRNQMDRILSTAICVLCGVGLIALLCMTVLSFWGPSILNVGEQEIPHLRLLFVLMGANLAVQFAGTAFTAYLLGLMRHHFVNTLRLVFAIIQGVVNCWLLLKYPDKGLLYLATTLLITSLVTYSIMAVKALKIGRPVTLFKSDWETLRDLLSFGVNSMLLLAADRIQRSCVPLVIAHSIGLDNVVLFALPNRLVEHARSSVAAVSTPLAPYFGYLDGKGDHAEKREKWLDLSKWTQFFCFGIGIVTLLLGVDFLRIWMGPQYAENGKWVLYLMATSFLIEGIVPNTTRYLVGTGKHRTPAKIQAALSVPILLLVVVGTKLLGISGAAIALLLGNAIVEIIFFLIVCKDLSISTREYFSATIARLTIPSIVAFSILIGIHSIIEMRSYFLIAASAALTCAAYGIAGWFLLPTPAEKEALNKKIVQFVPVLRKFTHAL
jgi:O-antigen/teichoic acid export membrane protein